jgi:hypothetical protein
MHTRRPHAPDGITSPSLAPAAAATPVTGAGLQLPQPKKRSFSIANHQVSNIDLLRSAIRVIPDFPKPGVSFKDITPLLRDPVAYNVLIQCMKERVLSISGGVHVMCALLLKSFSDL